jgi:plasmid stabilization system protein ParE
MDFKVIWSDQAIADLRDICFYIAGHDPDAALRIGNGILGHVRILAQHPVIGPREVPPRGASMGKVIVWYLTRAFLQKAMQVADNVVFIGLAPARFPLCQVHACAARRPAVGSGHARAGV